MISVVVLIHFFLLHFLFDWKLQSNWMALGKSTKPLNLFVHALVATAWCAAWGWKFWLMNFVLHAVTDQTTSQWTSALWFIEIADASPFEYHGTTWSHIGRFDARKRHWFFVAIGFDQCIHYITLVLTYLWLAT